MLVIGLMSGTSLDGVDVALVETDGDTITLGGNGRLDGAGRSFSLPYTPAETALLRAAKEEARHAIAARTDRPGCLGAAEALVTARHAEAVEGLLAATGLRRDAIAAIGFHGQTVLHRPTPGRPGTGVTVQIGDGAALAERLGIPVVFDFRAADVAAGGEGAPLVPVFHRALALACGYALPLAVLNIGGVANLTLIGPGDRLVGFDTGPGNALVNDLVAERTGAPFDEDGRLAAAGAVDEALLAWMLAHPYFRRPAPKSLDRDTFSHRFVGTLPTQDAAATLTAFTVRSVALGIAEGETPRRCIVGGGGARNGTMMAGLSALLPATEVVSADTVGWTADFLEAQAFAYLAARSLAGLPLTYPGTTGAPATLRGGVVARPGDSSPLSG